MKKSSIFFFFILCSQYVFSLTLPGTFRTYTAFTVHDEENSQVIQCVVKSYFVAGSYAYELTFNYYSIPDINFTPQYLTETKPDFIKKIEFKGKNEIRYNGFITESEKNINIQQKGILENGQIFFLIKDRGIYSFNIKKGYMYPLIDDRIEILDFTVKNNTLYLLSESKIQIKSINKTEEYCLISPASKIELSQNEQHLMIKLRDNSYYCMSLDNLSDGFEIPDASYADVLFNNQIVVLNNSQNSISLHKFKNLKKEWSGKFQLPDFHNVKIGSSKLEILNNRSLIIMRETWNNSNSKENEIVQIDLQSKKLESTVISGFLTFLNFQNRSLSFIDNNALSKNNNNYSGETR